SDIYSLGTVLYEAIAGEPPFTGEMQAVLYRVVHENPRSLLERGASISQELEDVIMRSLVKDSSRRYQSAGDFVEALKRYRSTLRESDIGAAIGLSSILTATLQRPAAAPFIGRQKEIAELQRRLNAAVDGECQFAVIAGEPGIGKTRLVEEIEHLARARKITVLHGRFMEQDRTFAYQGFCEAIQEFFRSPDTGTSGARPDVSDLAPDLIALFPVLSEISELRKSQSGEQPSQFAESRKAEDRTWVFELLARAIVRIGSGRALVLVFENLHSAELSLDALQYIVRRLGPTPTLIIGTYRQTEIDKRHPLVKMLDTFADDPRFSSTYLGPLSPSEHLSFIETMVGGAKLGANLAERLYDATEANPFFTRELVRSLIDSGGIARGDTGEWTLSGEMAISSDALPATIQQTVEKRIERLPEELRETLATASVMGRSFDFRDLESLADAKGSLDDVVDRLVYEGLIEEERESRGDRLAFSSGIVRDVLYSAVSRRKRKSLHRKYAELLEKRNAGKLERVYPQLVHHFSEGDVPDKTVEYGLILARRALDAFGSEEAVQTLRSVVEFLDDDDWSPPPGTIGEARMLLASALRQGGQIDSALREAETAVQSFERDKDRARASAAMLMAAQVAWQGRRIDETRTWLDRGVHAARGAGAGDVLADLLSLAATVANLRGEYAKAKELLDELEGLRPSSTTGDQDVAIPSGGSLVVALGNPSPATEPGEIALLEESETLGLVFEGLVTTDDRGHLVASLGESWDVIDDGRAMRLALREGVRFHDGSLLTAQSVKDSIEDSVRSRIRETAAWSVISGFEEFREGGAENIAGIIVHGERDLEIRLRESLPMYPALLTDPGTGIGHASVDTGGKRSVAGTGPFRIVVHDSERIVMEKNDAYWTAGCPRLDAIEFRVVRNASARAALMRSGEIDVGRELLPQDLDELLRDPRFRNGLQEVPNKITYFAVFNHATAAGGNDALRRALCGVLPVHDLVWGSLGRLAQPTTTLIPPGILGHDPGRRRHPMSREQAADLLAGSGLEFPLTLRAAVHPLYQDRYRALLDAMMEVWSSLGVEIEIATPTLESFMASYNEDDRVDLRIMRWAADYDDPDTFAHGLFHSGSGIVSRYFSSQALDQLIEEGRTERRPAAREAVYRRFEQAISESGSVLPLFHEIDYRLANPLVRGLQLRSTSPFVNYADLGKAAQALAVSQGVSGGKVVIPIGGLMDSIEPTRAVTVEMNEALPILFETLTRVREGARVVPWLASSIVSEDGGRRYRIRLRDDVRFHDGRRMSARDVRYTFERLFTLKGSLAGWLFTAIKGATELMEGRARELEGLSIVSSHEIVMELVHPLSFFPAVLSQVTSGIVPEGTQEMGTSWMSGCIGTGPFRVVAFESARRLELERNPYYWREGYPKSDALVFRFGVGSDEIREQFRAGELSLASDLRPSDVEALRHDPAFAAGYKEAPRLSIYFAVFNRNRGPLADPELRRRVIGAVDVAGIVQRQIGRLAIPAHGVIPPGLLGFEPAQASRSGAFRPRGDKLDEIELTAVVHPVFFEQYAGVGKELMEAFASKGVRIRVVSRTMSEYIEANAKGEADVMIGRWFADYPDSDTFAYGLVHRQAGTIGRFCGSAELDHLTERGREQSDPSTRHTIYQEIEQMVARDALLLPLFNEQIYRIARPEVDGLALNVSVPEVQYDELRVQR
ncbi:MAG TPA: BREX system ATP-binding domain-containing protein, partial [Thermoanaerobaculia bacterium]|nr:BREX system ATP-binding domain-containing protein [Thermoanaerobaculia bacterium]